MPEDIQKIPLVDFRARCDIDPVTKCWSWRGANVRGYGHVTINYRAYQAHRVAYRQYVGPIPAGLLVLHTCDNPSCVNPDHLYAGTQKQNIADCIQRGRRARTHSGGQKGESNPVRRLSDDDVIAIRLSGDPQTVMAKRYGVSQPRISKIIRREAWTHLP